MGRGTVCDPSNGVEAPDDFTNNVVHHIDTVRISNGTSNRSDRKINSLKKEMKINLNTHNAILIEKDETIKELHERCRLLERKSRHFQRKVYRFNQRTRRS